MPDQPSDPNLPCSQRLIADLEASPSPYHAAQRAGELLAAAGFESVSLNGRLPTSPGRYFSVDGGALLAWGVPPEAASGFCIVGAHTDSPNLRVQSQPDRQGHGWSQLGIEVYGGILANSWLDRDLGLAGRVTMSGPNGQTRTELFIDDRPLLRVPQLAIHLDRDIRDKGLLLNNQQHLAPLWASGTEAPPFVDYLAIQVGGSGDWSVVAWDVMAFDVQPPAIVGLNQELISSARIDNQLSCFAACYALERVVEAWDESGPGSRVPVLALYDHEEVGSETSTGAAGAFLGQVLERISLSRGLDRAQHLAELRASFVVSADGAHATNPNYADRHEPQHHVELNAGVVIKRNVNQRYASDATSDGFFRSVCAAADVPVQTYHHRNDLPCGSTIGPITAAALAIPTVDVGAPQLAMHSVREMAGTDDVAHLCNALAAVWLHHDEQVS